MIFKYKQIFIALGLAIFVCLIAMVPLNNEVQAFHTEGELNYFKSLDHMMMDPVDSNLIFPKATNCEGCHGFDENMHAYIDNDGNDVNVFDDWQSTMMANSAKDPFWRAKVSHEVLAIPGHADDIETKCTSCHAPMGHYTAILRGAAHYTMDELAQDSIGLDGVSCGACHQIKDDENFGLQFSGEISYDTMRNLYGPYPFPFDAPMNDFVGFSPKFSEHINDAKLCASCHTLITDVFDLEGNPTGDKFVEQATYHEWLNSDYGLQEISCQHCHIPSIDDSIVIAANLLFLEGRTPFGLHEMVGANTFMLNVMKNNIEALGIEASPEQFDETIAKTLDMLQTKSVEIELELDNVDNDSAYFSVAIRNLAGHKFPSGYPSRRAFVEFKVVKEDGSSLFESGVLDETYEVVGHDPVVEPHYKMINDPNQVQIYEMVNGDINGNFTSVLERSYTSIKDNRLPPAGFTTSHEVYDTTLVVGNALTDANFNYEDGVEGSGKDIVQYHVPLNGYNGNVDIIASVWYQSLPPKWMEEIFAATTPEIEDFRTMYYDNDQSPVLCGSDTLSGVGIETVSVANEIASGFNVYPNPTMDGVINVELGGDEKVVSVLVFDMEGRVVFEGNSTKGIQLPVGKGVYRVKVETDKGAYFRSVVRW